LRVHVHDDLDARRSNVFEHIRTCPRWVIALSGGVDSAVLLALAAEALGSRAVVAVTGRSPAVTEGEIADAAAVSASLGVAHEIVSTHEMDNPSYVANLGDRCFHCRTELFTILSAIARDREPARIAYGAIVDDLGDDRPGMEAAKKFGIAAPLLDAGLTKTDVRRLASDLGLRVADKPANPCLASRIPAGTPVTAGRLSQVARAESALRALGFRVVRVRHHGGEARIEVPPDDLARLRDLEARGAIRALVADAGFASHLLDPEGYRPAGSRSRKARLYSIAPQLDGGQ
jgi:uncharacterized protein